MSGNFGHFPGVSEVRPASLVGLTAGSRGRAGKGAIMGLAALHEYDLDLCDYAAGNVRARLGDPDFARFLKEELPPSLFAYLQQGLDPEDEQNLLLLGE